MSERTIKIETLMRDRMIKKVISSPNLVSPDDLLIVFVSVKVIKEVHRSQALRLLSLEK